MDPKQQGQVGQSAASETPSSSAPSTTPKFLLDLQYPSLEQNSKSDNNLKEYPPDLRQMLQMQHPKDTSQANIPTSNPTAAAMPNVSSSSYIQPSSQATLRPQQFTQPPSFHPFLSLGDRTPVDYNILRNTPAFQTALQNLSGSYTMAQFKGHITMPNSAQIAFPAHRLANSRPIMNRNDAVNNLYTHGINPSSQQFAAPPPAQLSAVSGLNALGAPTAAQAARPRSRTSVRPRPPSLNPPAPTGPGAPIPHNLQEGLQNVLKNLKAESRTILADLLSRLKAGEISSEEFSRLIRPQLGDQFSNFMQSFQAYQPQNPTPPIQHPNASPSLLAPRPSTWSAQNLAAKTAPPQDNGQVSARPSQSESKSSDAQGTDFGLLTDVMGSVGVDLKEESENILRGVHGTSSGRSTGSNPNPGDGSETAFTAPTPLLDPVALKVAISGIASIHGIQDVNSEVCGYISLAVEERLRDLVEQMINASIQRNHSQSSFPAPPLADTGRPVFRVAVALDPKKQLQAFERVDRHLARAFQQRLEEGSQLDEDGEPRTKRTKSRKDPGSGPTSSVRNLSEDARKRNANQTTHMFTGGLRKSWMTVSSVNTAPRVSSPLASTPPTTPAVEKPAPKTPPPASHTRHLPSTSSSLVPSIASGPSSPLPAEPKGTGTNPSQFQKPPHPNLLNLPARGAKSASPGSRFAQARRPAPRSISAQDALFVLESDQAGRPHAARSRLLIKLYSNRH